VDQRTYWTGHILSGDANLFNSFQASTAVPAQPADQNANRQAAIWFCALRVTAIHYSIDASDPAGSLSKPTDWTNAAAQQPAVMALNINQEAPAVAAHEAAAYNLQWTAVTSADLTGCATVGAVALMIQGKYA
jgi:hypothetical protein